MLARLAGWKLVLPCWRSVSDAIAPFVHGPRQICRESETERVHASPHPPATQKVSVAQHPDLELARDLRQHAFERRIASSDRQLTHAHAQASSQGAELRQGAVAAKAEVAPLRLNAHGRQRVEENPTAVVPDQVLAAEQIVDRRIRRVRFDPRPARKEPERHAPHTLGNQIRLRRAHEANREIRIMAEDVDQVVGDHELEQEARVCFSEGREHPGQHFDRKHLARSDPHRALDGVSRSRRSADQLLESGLHGLRRASQRLGELGGSKPRGRSHEERRAQACFQLLDMPPDGRMGHAERTCRPRQRSRAEHGEKRATELPVRRRRVHPFSYSCCTTCSMVFVLAPIRFVVCHGGHHERQAKLPQPRLCCTHPTCRARAHPRLPRQLGTLVS